MKSPPLMHMVRKVDSSYIVGSLCEKNLIEVCGKLDVPGKPNLYRTTSTFLRCFGIESLEQLPYIDAPRQKNEGEIIPLDIEIPEMNESDDASYVNNGDGAEELELLESPEMEIDGE